MTQMDYKYSLLGSAVDDYRKRPLLLQVDDTPMNLFAVLEVKRELPRRWSTLGYFRKIRLYSFMFGLAVTFLIMASYILTGDKKGLLLTPSPYHFSSLVSPGPFAFNLSLVKDYAHVKLVVKSITSKVEFGSSRQIPELKALVNSEPHVSSQNKLYFCLISQSTFSRRSYQFIEMLREKVIQISIHAYMPSTHGPVQLHW